MYFVQWKYEDVEGDWRYCDYQSWNGNNQIFVHKLQPYTKYRVIYNSFSFKINPKSRTKKLIATDLSLINFSFVLQSC